MEMTRAGERPPRSAQAFFDGNAAKLGKSKDVLMRGRAYAITRATSRSSAVARALAGHMAGARPTHVLLERALCAPLMG